LTTSVSAGFMQQIAPCIGSASVPVP